MLKHNCVAVICHGIVHNGIGNQAGMVQVSALCQIPESAAVMRSVIALEIRYAVQRIGYRVFFSAKVNKLP